MPPAGPSASIYARLRTTEETPFYDLLDNFDPASYFIGSGSVIKEAIDDMEWAHGSVTITMNRDPPELKFSSAKDNRRIEVEIPVDTLSGFRVAGNQIRWKYTFKHLKVIFANSVHSRKTAIGGNVLSKVAIDGEGRMKVTHMLRVSGAGEDVGGGGELASHPLATGDGGGGSGGDATSRGAVQRVVVAQFALLALFDGGDGVMTDDDV